MSRTKIDYGIDLGTTNSAISRMENGETVIKKTDTSKDTMPSCVFINRKKAIQVGDSAFNALERDKLSAMKNWDDSRSNSFIEFKRTMGTDKKYFSSNFEKNLSSEELSANILKALKSFIKDENVNAAIITVPAAFKNNQIDATRRAANLAGISQVEVLQEPVAASIAYGLDSKNKNGFWLVFDFGGGTFDAALLKNEDGINKVIDTEGNSYLGGKNLDMAIVDEIIMPYLKENYAIDSVMADNAKKQILRNAMKFYAEKTKIALSFGETHNILSDLGAIPGEDDNGEEFDLDITVTQDDMQKVLAPIFQKAIDVCQILLNRNNLKGSLLDSLILVGGPTFSPILRNMLAQQITDPDTSVDPMTVISRGAALYASTVSLSDEIKDETRDRNKIQIEIGHEASTVETEDFVTLKVLPDKTKGKIPEKVLAEISQIGTGTSWSSGKIEINDIGEVIKIELNEDRTNNFTVILYDNEGNLLESEPKSFSIIQGISGLDTMQGLTLNWGIEIKQRSNNKIVFKQVKGLETNNSLPVIGTENGLKTQKQIRPGMDTDFIKIPLYQGEHNADGTRAIYNEHVYDIKISGTDLPGLLPENSDVDLTINIDKSQNVSVEAYFPYLDHTTEIKVPTETVQSVDTKWLSNEFKKAKGSITELKSDENNSEILQKTEKDINDLEKQFSSNKDDVDNKQEVLTNLRKSLKTIDELSEKAEWPNLEEQLKKEFYRLEKANDELGDDQTNHTVNQLRNQLEEVILRKDIKLGNAILEEIRSLHFELTRIYQFIGIIRDFNDNFGSFNWSDSHRARQLLNDGLQRIGSNPTVEELQPIVVSLINLLPREERPGDDDTVLVG